MFCNEQNNGYPLGHSVACAWVSPDWIERLVPTTGIGNKQLSLVDKCHVMGTAHLYKQRPLSHCPATVDRRYQSQARRCSLLIKFRPSLFRLYDWIVLDEVALALFSESCCKFGTWTGQLYEWWEQHHNDQANKEHVFGSVDTTLRVHKIPLLTINRYMFRPLNQSLLQDRPL